MKVSRVSKRVRIVLAAAVLGVAGFAGGYFGGHATAGSSGSSNTTYPKNSTASVVVVNQRGPKVNLPKASGTLPGLVAPPPPPVVAPPPVSPPPVSPPPVSPPPVSPPPASPPSGGSGTTIIG
jgi:hypothetical protein